MAITKPELKKRVLKYLNKNGDTFTDITSTLLNTGIEQHNIKYLLDELQHDGLIILSKANPHLNSNQHVLNAASNVQARITPNGRKFVKEHHGSWLDYLEKHPIIRIILIVGGVAGLIALIAGLF